MFQKQKKIQIVVKFFKLAQFPMRSIHKKKHIHKIMNNIKYTLKQTKQWNKNALNRKA